MECGEFLNHSFQLQEESIERLKIVNSMKEKIQQDGPFIYCVYITNWFYLLILPVFFPVFCLFL